MALDPRLLEILACPEDKGPLLYFADEDALYNPRLRRRYQVNDGIPIMLIDEAQSVDDAEHQRLLAKAHADGITPTFEAADSNATDSNAADVKPTDFKPTDDSASGPSVDIETRS